MSNMKNLHEYLAAEKASRREQQKDVPDSEPREPTPSGTTAAS